jgi:hypothetical protein
MRDVKQRFELAAVLGEGGCGKVFRARDVGTGQEVALKLLNAAAKNQSRLFQRFVREAKALARIEHPNVTGVVASDFEGETPWIALEYVEGQDLERRLRREGPFDVTAGRTLARQLAEALGELHRHGIIHRDLKPSNLMLRAQDGSLAVTDLGLAALSDATVVTETGELFGTPLYMPPEVVAGKPWTTQGDVYQAGAVLFEVFTGLRMIPGAGMAEIMAAILDGQRQRFPPGTPVPPALQQVIHKATAVDPAERYASADALLQGLQQSLHGGPQGEGQVTRELASLESGLIGGRAATGPGGIPWTRWIPALLLVGCGLGFLAGGLTGPAAPRDIHWQVIGDAVLVSYLAPGNKSVRLNVGQQLLAPDPGPGSERRRIVFRGLSPTDETVARLVWSGGESPPYPAFGEPPAVRRVAGATKDGGVLLEATRACEAWWSDAPAVRFRLEKGKTGVPLKRPLAKEVTLFWEEQGLEFSRGFSRDEVLADMAAALLDYGAVSDFRPVLSQRRMQRGTMTGSNFQAERAPWRRYLAWIPDILEADLSGRARGDLWERLVQWQMSVAGERFLGDSPPGLPIPPGRAGSYFQGEPRENTWRVEAGYEPLDGARPRHEHEPRRLSMITNALKDNPGFGKKALDYATRVEVTWPDLPSGPTPVHCLTIDADRLKSHHIFQVRLRGGEEDGDLVYFHPSELGIDVDKVRGPLTRCYPAAFSPPPGTPVLLTLEPLITSALDFGGIRGVAVHVPKGE